MRSSCLVSAGVRGRHSGGIQVWVQLVLHTILVSYQGCIIIIIIIIITSSSSSSSSSSSTYKIYYG
jgi:hypothetical protein